MKSITTYFLLLACISGSIYAMDTHALRKKVVIRTPLHSAACMGNRQACKVFIQYYTDAGQKVDQRDSDGNTPLHLAASRGQYEICELLIKHGANCSARNFNGQMPYDVRKRGLSPLRQEDFLELLLPWGAVSEDSSNDDSEKTDIDDPENALAAQSTTINLRIRHHNPLRVERRGSLFGTAASE